MCLLSSMSIVKLYHTPAQGGKQSDLYYAITTSDVLTVNNVCLVRK